MDALVSHYGAVGSAFRTQRPVRREGGGAVAVLSIVVFLLCCALTALELTS